MKRLILLLALLLSLTACARCEEALRAEGDIQGYRDNPLTILSPAEGEATLTVEDGLNTWRTLKIPVRAGENICQWDGLGEHGERLAEGVYTLRLTLPDGTETETRINKIKDCQAVEWALPGSDTLYLEDNDWYAELDPVRQGNITMAVYRGEELLGSVTRSVSYGLQKWKWNGRLQGEAVPEGEYTLRFFGEENPDWTTALTVTVREGSRPEMPLFVTGSIMPEEGASPEELWALAEQPAVVADVGNTAHLTIYAKQSTASQALGTVHGQSQALEVLELDGDWTRVRAWVHEDGTPAEGWVQTKKLKVVTPRQDYLLVIDKKAQTLTVYDREGVLGSYGVSTGLTDKGKLYQETAAGSFLTQEHMVTFSTNGNNYDYVIRYDGGNLLHRCAWRDKNGLKDFSQQRESLGTKASHGCVRMEPFCTSDGVNAWWVYTHIAAGTRVLVLDDPEERTREALNAELSLEPDRTLTEAEAVPELTEADTELVLTFGGDTVLGTREAWWQDEDALPAFIQENGAAWPFRQLQSLFGSDDLTVVNLECTLQATSVNEDKTKEYRFRGLPEWASALPESGVEAVNIANNHIIDYGDDGMVSTISALRAADVLYSGYGRLCLWEKDGITIGFAGCRETVWKEDPGVIAREVESLREQGADVVIYSCHWGREYSALHNETQEEMALCAAQAGADIVIGTHPHVVQGVEELDGTLVLYSLGNMMFGGTKDMTTFDGTLARVRLRFRDGEYQGAALTLIPIETSSSQPENDCSPRIAQGEAKTRILAKLQADSDVRITEEMYFPKKRNEN